MREWFMLYGYMLSEWEKWTIIQFVRDAFPHTLWIEPIYLKCYNDTTLSFRSWKHMLYGLSHILSIFVCNVTIKVEMTLEITSPFYSTFVHYERKFFMTLIEIFNCTCPAKWYVIQFCSIFSEKIQQIWQQLRSNYTLRIIKCHRGDAVTSKGW